MSSGSSCQNWFDEIFWRLLMNSVTIAFTKHELNQAFIGCSRKVYLHARSCIDKYHGACIAQHLSRYLLITCEVNAMLRCCTTARQTLNNTYPITSGTSFYNRILIPVALLVKTYVRKLAEVPVYEKTLNFDNDWS